MPFTFCSEFQDCWTCNPEKGLCQFLTNLKVGTNGLEVRLHPKFTLLITENKPVPVAVEVESESICPGNVIVPPSCSLAISSTGDLHVS